MLVPQSSRIGDPKTPRRRSSKMYKSNLNPNFPISAFTSVAFNSISSFPLFLLFQITKKSLNAAFTSVSEDALESSKESVDLSSISEIADSDHIGEIAEVRLNLNLCDFRFLGVQFVVFNFSKIFRFFEERKHKMRFLVSFV